MANIPTEKCAHGDKVANLVDRFERWKGYECPYCEIERLEREREGWASVAATRNVNIALIAEERDRLRAALNLERQRLVSWADRLNKRGKNEAADEVWERVEAIDQAMRPALDVGETRSTEGTCTCPPGYDPLGCAAETCPRAIAARNTSSRK